MLYKVPIIILLALTLVFVSGCVNYQNFDKEGLSLKYPGNWSENPIPANDQALANKSGFNILGVYLQGGSIGNYTYYTGVARGNITNGNLTETADRLYNNFIIEEADSTPIVNRITLKNGYECIVYSYNGTGVSSGQTIYERTYIFTKDNKSAYYVMFATRSTSSIEKEQIWQTIMDSAMIK